MSFLKSPAQESIKDSSKLRVAVAMPFFLYEGDRMELAATITNNSGQEITGQAVLQLTDATTNTSVDGWFQNVFPTQYFTIAAGKSEVVPFPIEVPYLFKKPLHWQVVARAGNSADSAAAIIPIRTIKKLVTETMLLPVVGGVRNFKLDNLLHADPVTEHQSLTIELFSNPIWQVVLALPYLAETKYESAEQLWNKLYAFALAQKISTTSPGIQKRVSLWKDHDTSGLYTPLLKHEKLRALLQEETPWILDAPDETERTVARLFDTTTVKAGLYTSFQKLKKAQNSNGSFSWFGNEPEDRFITQSLVTGMGYLKTLDALATIPEEQIMAVLRPALSYLDQKLAGDYNQLLKQNGNLKKKQLTPVQVQYLYARSFFTDVLIQEATLPAYRFYLQQTRQYWKEANNLLQAYTALALYRNGDSVTPNAILQALHKRVLIPNRNANASYWWQDAIMEKAALIEAYNEINEKDTLVNALLTALLSEKGVNAWQTTNSTVAALYAILLQPEKLKHNATVRLKTGDSNFSNAGPGNELEDGYLRKVIVAQHIKPDMGNIQVAVDWQGQKQVTQASLPAALHWRYFQDSESAQVAPAALKINKQLFVKRSGNSLPVDETTLLQVADTVVVRLTITATKDLTYIQLKDRHAAALKHVDSIIGYKKQAQLKYYQLPEAGHTFFLMPTLKKGTSVLEYKLLATQAGAFSNGAATLQSRFAPAFTIHSNVMRIQVE